MSWYIFSWTNWSCLPVCFRPDLPPTWPSTNLTWPDLTWAGTAAGHSDPPAEADAAAASGAAPAEDRPLHAVQQHDPDAAAGAVLAGRPLAGLRVVRHRRWRATTAPRRVGHRWVVSDDSTPPSGTSVSGQRRQHPAEWDIGEWSAVTAPRRVGHRWVVSDDSTPPSGTSVSDQRRQHPAEWDIGEWSVATAPRRVGHRWVPSGQWGFSAALTSCWRT